MASPAGTLRLLLVPSLLTLALCVVRIVGEVQGWIDPATGGAFSPLGIVWLVFVFGGWFGWQLGRAGQGPRGRRAWLAALGLGLALVGATVWQFSGIDRAGRTEADFAALRAAVLTIAAVGAVAMLLTFAVWPRLAWTLLLYGLFARGLVVALTWLAKANGWNTHYTKFGPAGIERDLAATMTSAAAAQFGIWVPFTVVMGTLTGTLLARRSNPTG